MPPAKPSTFLDTRVVYCNDNLDNPPSAVPTAQALTNRAHRTIWVMAENRGDRLTADVVQTIGHEVGHLPEFLLVKGEWDEAGKWMTDNVDK